MTVWALMGESDMAHETAPDSARVENVLRTVDFFRPVSTRRVFLGKLLAAGGGVAAASSVGTLASVTPAFAAGTSFPSAAVGAERIAVAFYGNALGVLGLWDAVDLAKGRLLNFAPRELWGGKSRSVSGSALVDVMRPVEDRPRDLWGKRTRVNSITRPRSNRGVNLPGDRGGRAYGRQAAGLGPRREVRGSAVRVLGAGAPGDSGRGTP